MRKRRVVGRIYDTEYGRKGHKNRNRLKNIIKKEWPSLVGLCKIQTATPPPREGEPVGTDD